MDEECIKTGQDVKDLLTKPSENGDITMLNIGDEDFNDYREQQ